MRKPKGQGFCLPLVTRPSKINPLNKLTMKKLFFALALTGIIGAATVSTVSAMTHSTVIVKGGDEKKKDKKDCKKDSKCCSKDAASATASEKKEASEGKNCSKGKTCCHAKTETKAEEKKAVETK